MREVSFFVVLLFGVQTYGEGWTEWKEAKALKDQTLKINPVEKGFLDGFLDGLLDTKDGIWAANNCKTNAQGVCVIGNNTGVPAIRGY